MDLLKKYPIFIFYILIGIAHLSLIYLNPDWANYTKPTIAVILIIAAIMHWHKKNMGVSITLILALLLSGLGDYALIKRGFAYLLAGMGFFWLTLLSYILCYYLLVRKKTPSQKSNRYFLGVIAIISLAFIAYLMTSQCTRADGVLTPCVGSKLKLPLTVYAFTLLWMFLKAVKVSDYFNIQTAKLIGIGALLFLLSDGLFAYSSWIDRSFSVHLHFGVMLIYIIAQGLISFGLATLSDHATESTAI